jgi:AmmeMemoRadiSam system protein B
MNRNIRKPAVAGTFYPSSPAELKRMVDEYLNKVVRQEIGAERLVALIAPHAGYVYSGQVAAYSYKKLIGQEFRTVVIVGPSHFVAFKGASIYANGFFQTPLGEVEVDTEFANELMAKEPRIQFLARVHSEEHSIEVQIPFLQRALANADFKIVPILLHDFSESNCKMLSEALASTLKERKALLIASTDLTHYPVYDEALKADSVTIGAIKSLDPALIRNRTDEYMKKKVYNLYCMMCGTGAVISVIDTAKSLGAKEVDIAKYANSGDASIGSKDRVVGYLAAGIYR